MVGGHFPHLLLQQSEVDSCWQTNLYEKTKIEVKGPGVLPNLAFNDTVESATLIFIPVLAVAVALEDGYKPAFRRIERQAVGHQ